jgi:hypothetical protein
LAGLLATNTIAQGDTREVGLYQLVGEREAGSENRGAEEQAFPHPAPRAPNPGCSIIRAVPSMPWPGAAALEVSHVWLYRGAWAGEYYLNHAQVAGITPFLTPPGRLQGKPFRLKANENKSFQGSIVLGMGFVLEPEQATALIAQNPKNKDCLFPYLNGEDLNSRPDQSPSRRVINFHDWPLNRTAAGQWIGADYKQQKTWLSLGVVPADYLGKVAGITWNCWR